VTPLPRAGVVKSWVALGSSWLYSTVTWDFPGSMSSIGEQLVSCCGIGLLYVTKVRCGHEQDLHLAIPSVESCDEGTDDLKVAMPPCGATFLNIGRPADDTESWGPLYTSAIPHPTV
jgi:hypothetical protein